MKNFKSKAYSLGLLCLVIAAVVIAQGPTSSRLPSHEAGNDIAYVPAFNAWQLQVTGTNSTGTSTLAVASGNVTLADGTNLSPLSTNAPITILDANSETVTPSAIGSACSQGPNQQPSSCTFTASFTYVHGSGSRIVSGTYGLQEAINYAHGGAGGNVIVHSGFPGSVSTITAAAGFVDTQITYNHSGYPINYVWNGSNYVSNPSGSLATVLLLNPITTPTSMMTQTQVAGQQNFAGRKLSYDGVGYATAGTGGTATVRFYLLVGTVPVCDITSAALANSAANYPWKFHADLITATTGATGTLESHCTADLASAVSGTTATSAYYDDNNVATQTVDLTAANTIALQTMFSASVATSRMAQRVQLIKYVN
ncbi:MAG TPA: hypothetical protein VNH83_26005 [Bryobacteraceae bacterium]|nr:hypothetical protein [Bryobacteraceae bacterium]